VTKFRSIVALALAGPLLLMLSFWRTASNWIHTEARGIYVEASKTLIAASSIAIAILLKPIGRRAAVLRL